MSANPFSTTPNPETATTDVRVIGLGGAGGRILAELIKGGFPPSAVVALDAEEWDLESSPAALRFAVQCRRLRGLGTGGDPEIGEAAVEENREPLTPILAGTPAAFLVAGLGGGFATGAAPAIATMIKQSGAVVIGVLVLPFACEGRRRMAQAMAAHAQLKAICDVVLTLPNDAVFKLLTEDASVVDSFSVSNRLLADTTRGLWQLLTGGGPVALPFADLRGVLQRQNAEGSFAGVEGAGTARVEQVLARLKAHPLLNDNPGFAEARLVLVHFAGGKTLALTEVDAVMRYVSSRTPGAMVKFGVTVEESLGDRLMVTIIATRPALTPAAGAPDPAELIQTTAPYDPEFLSSRETARPAPRVMPPAPDFTPEKRQQIMAEHTRTGMRGRGRSKAKQNQLQFDLVSKGRFEKSTPTIHHGEDLDLPTYIRRGLSLN